jgi:hypothetical protein
VISHRRAHRGVRRRGAAAAGRLAHLTVDDLDLPNFTRIVAHGETTPVRVPPPPIDPATRPLQLGAGRGTAARPCPSWSAGSSDRRPPRRPRVSPRRRRSAARRQI